MDLSGSTKTYGLYSSNTEPSPPEKTPEKKETLWTMSAKKKVVLCCLLLGTMKSFMCLSLVAPFYPGEALSRGTDQFVASWVFSIYAITQFITAPLFGKAIPIVGARFLYICGAFICGASTILFGFLDLFPTDNGPGLFIGFSFAIRVVQAFGGTAWFSSGLAIAMNMFQGNAATVMALMDAFIGLGFVIGPALGGALYEVGGFVAPFATVGAMVFAFMPLYFIFLDTTKERAESASVFTLFKSSLTWIVTIDMACAVILIVAISPILEIHLQEFGLSVAQVGLVFVLHAALYAVSATGMGIAVDRMNEVRGWLIIGFLIVFCGYFFLGPSPLTPLVEYQALWLNLVSVALIGVGAGPAFVPSYKLLMIAAADAGMPDNMSTHGAVSGLFTSSVALGEAVGTAVSGWLTEDYGFAWSTTVFAFLSLAMVLLLLTYIGFEKLLPKKKSKPDEETSLIHSKG